jgi:hypothetical protein
VEKLKDNPSRMDRRQVAPKEKHRDGSQGPEAGLVEFGHALPLLRFFATGLDFGRFLILRGKNSPKCSFMASKISPLRVISIAAACLSHAAQASSGWEMFLRSVIL